MPVKALSLSDNQVNALRTVATGTDWERSRINRGTVKSLIRRGLLHQPHPQGWGLAEITAEGRAALATFPNPAGPPPAAEWAPAGTTGVKVGIRTLEPGDEVLVAHTFAYWQLSSATDTQRYSRWAKVLSRRGRTVILRVDTETTTEGATLRALADNTLVVKREKGI